jgi:aminoglycoside 6-adenylyltransferase
VGDPVLDRLVAWAQSDARVRALILTSSRTNPAAPVDALSDYDVVLAVADWPAFVADEDWISAFGRPISQFRDTATEAGQPIAMRLVLYEDGTKIDYMVCPAALLPAISTLPRLPDNFDVGYRVLLDKDDLTRDLPPPTFTAHIPTPPSAAEYQALIAEFWWETGYVAKNLWRDELVAARYSFDHVMKFQLLQTLLVWRIELDHNWTLKPGSVGRGLKRHLPADLWAAYAATYVGADLADNWAALWRATALFRRVAGEVGSHLGYPYPAALDADMMHYLQGIAALEPRPLR